MVAEKSEGSDSHPERVAAFFDLDKTIIAKSSVMAFSKQFRAEGLMNRRSMIQGAYSQLVFLLSSADAEKTEQLRAYLSKLVAGWDVATVTRIVSDTLQTAVRPILYAEAVRLIDEHHSAGHDVVIVSASGYEVAEPIGRMLGADRVIATEMTIQDGRYTGEIQEYVFGEGKGKALRSLANVYDLDRSYAYADSLTDLPMLEQVGHPYVVNPSSELRRIAMERGWPVFEFRLPASPEQSIPRLAKGAAVLAGAVAVGGVAWLAVRNRR